MWSRKELKKKSRNIMKKHYWRVIAVCFVAALAAGSYNGTFSAVFSYDSSREIRNVIQENTVFDFNDIRMEKPLDTVIRHFEQKHVQEEEMVKKSPYTKGVLSGIVNYSLATGSVFFGYHRHSAETCVPGRVAFSDRRCGRSRASVFLVAVCAEYH